MIARITKIDIITKKENTVVIQQRDGSDMSMGEYRHRLNLWIYEGFSIREAFPFQTESERQFIMYGIMPETEEMLANATIDQLNELLREV